MIILYLPKSTRHSSLHSEVTHVTKKTLVVFLSSASPLLKASLPHNSLVSSFAATIQGNSKTMSASSLEASYRLMNRTGVGCRASGWCFLLPHNLKSCIPKLGLVTWDWARQQITAGHKIQHKYKLSLPSIRNYLEVAYNFNCLNQNVHAETKTKRCFVLAAEMHQTAQRLPSKRFHVEALADGKVDHVEDYYLVTLTSNI